MINVIIQTSRLLSFIRDTSGNIALTFSILAVPVIGAIASAVDYSGVYREKTELQEAADTAVMFAASDADPKQIDEDALTKTANNVLQAHFGSEFPEINLELTQTDTTVEVTLEKPYDTSFLQLLGFEEIDVVVGAQATYAAPDPGPFCVLATANDHTGFSDTGSGDLISQDCGIRVNSADNNDALELIGSGDIDVDNLCITGKANIITSGSFADGTVLTEGCAPTPNPFTRTKVLPSKPQTSSLPSCDYTNFWISGSRGGTMQPGVYCGTTTIVGSGAISFASNRDYTFLNGKFSLQGSFDLDFGDGDFKFINAPFEIIGSADKNFGDGEYTFVDSDLIISGSGDVNFGTGNMSFVNSDLTIEGGSDKTFVSGNYYFYDSELEIRGNGPVTFGPGSLNFVDARLAYTGSGDFIATGVHFYFANNGSGFDITGSGMNKLSADTAGDFAGILIYFDPSITTGVNKIVGSGDTLIDGVVNAAGSDIILETSGTVEVNANSNLSVFVANRIVKQGNQPFIFRINPLAPFIPGELVTEQPSVQVYLSK